MRARILVVDDDRLMAQLIARTLVNADYDCEVCTSGEAALEAFNKRAADLVISDVVMPTMEGTELLRELHERTPGLPVILLTSYGTIPSAVAAMRDGAYTYLTKPVDDDELLMLISRALELTRLERENHYLRQELASRYGPEAVVAASPQSRELLDFVRRVAPSRATVLIQGESGTGKELVARLLHFWSERVGYPFVAVNCKAFAEGVLDSELFGHEKGAFTGAIAARAGCFERATNGTLFLDEIGDISAEFQSKLLRVLEEDEVLRVGGSEPKKVSVRVVTATNRNLRDDVSAGRFREDLFFRLNVIPISVAPLRERPEDIVPLAQHFLTRRALETGRPLRFAPEVEQLLLSYSWPGNVRELENAIERAIVIAPHDLIRCEDFLLEPPRHPPFTIANASQRADLNLDPVSEHRQDTLQESIDHAISARILAALKEANGNRTEAARLLDLNRTKFYRLIKRLRI